MMRGLSLSDAFAMSLFLDPHVADVIAEAMRAGRTPTHLQSPAEARAGYRAACAAAGPPRIEMAAVADITLAGRPCRHYRPVDADVLPGLLYLHGGGWVMGDLDSHDGVCRRLAADTGFAVVAVDYRLAPEHPFPAAFNDAIDAWTAFAGQSASLGLDATRLGIAGDSAGAALAAAVSLACRERTADQRPRVQMLFYPVTDLAADSASYAEITRDVFLTADVMRWFIDHYAPDPAARGDWRASPLRAADLAGSPPALVVTVGHDPLRDEGAAYARALVDAGNQVTHLHLANQVHGLLTQARLMPASEAVFALAAVFARQGLA
jgi:acetyl esterase